MQRPFDALTQHQTSLLRRSAMSMGIDRCGAVAESIYAQFADIPGTHSFLYDLPARIQSTARFLGVLVTLVSAHPLDTRRLEVEFTAVGRAHARAGLPPVLLDLGAAVFVRCMAAAAAENGRAWSPQDMFVWETLMRTGVDIQKRAYTQTANQDQNAPPAVAAPPTSVAPYASSATEPENRVE
ncbi:hypothetical protein [Nocardia sp. alder85J]|uniref:hypothetical protein n=1 Tax=Nocardia sp. alder85J TaxID=2862949 RepID=UPI001CD6A13B|nr:hypothetical protein [Nocardia sp. alder85J]MCX4094469.1 hypothetical protein [Nocardia sp. alder85J]